MLWHRQAIFQSKGDKLCSSAECRIWTRGPRHQIASRLNARQPFPMISEHSAHLTRQPFGIGTWLWRYACLLLLISMFWHRQAIFKSKGDKLCSSAECRIWTHWQTDWAIEDQAKNLNSTARPYDQRAFSPLDPTAVWHWHLALAIYMFVVVHFDVLAQASDICLLTNRLSYRGSSKKLELDSPSLWSASIQPTWPHCQLTFAPGSGDIHICC